jgi:bifunctional UDP-N-acetylglucosamine pyrophosphorylase/glucosamine-1-phosphate N-acetyltransferase
MDHGSDCNNNNNINNNNKGDSVKITSHGSNRYTVIMAGGSGTRMGSTIPKQLLLVGRKPMMMHLIDNAHNIGTEIVLIVSTKNRDIIISTLTEYGYITHLNKNEYCYKGTPIHLCIQSVANGTGGALIATNDFFSDKNPNDVLLSSVLSSVLVLSADVPLITRQTMLSMFEKIESPLTDCVILAKETTNNFGYGRIVTDNNGDFLRIVEQKDCNEQEKQITLINTGTYAFKLNPLLKSFAHLTCNNAQNEYYLTDCPKFIKECAQSNIISVHLMTLSNSLKLGYDETLGANTPEQLEHLRNEYIRKFSIQQINESDNNMTDENV